LLSNGSIRLNGTGYPALTYRVQASTNLGTTNWFTIGTVTVDPSGVLQFLDTNTIVRPQRFYRFVTP